MRIYVTSGTPQKGAVPLKKQETKKSKKKSKLNIVEEIPKVNLAIEEEIDKILEDVKFEEDLNLLNESK